MSTSFTHCLFFLFYAKRNTFFGRFGVFHANKYYIGVKKPSCFFCTLKHGVKTFIASVELGLGPGAAEDR